MVTLKVDFVIYSPPKSYFYMIWCDVCNCREGQHSPQDWHRVYGKCSGNEVYSIVL